MIIITAGGDTLYLPFPQLRDSERTKQTIQLKTFMDGTHRTYVQKTNNKVVAWEFQLQMPKAEELRTFITNHSGVLWDIIGFGYDGQGWCLTNPTEIDVYARATGQGAGDERALVRLGIEFK